jgi:hypothetical protein
MLIFSVLINSDNNAFSVCSVEVAPIFIRRLKNKQKSLS